MAACHEPGLRCDVSCGRAGWLFGKRDSTGAVPGRHMAIRTKALHVGHRPGGKVWMRRGSGDQLAVLFVFVAEGVAGDLHDR